MGDLHDLINEKIDDLNKAIKQLTDVLELSLYGKPKKPKLRLVNDQDQSQGTD